MKKKIITIILYIILSIALGQQLYRLYFVFLQDNFVDLSVYITAANTTIAHGNVYAQNPSIIPFNYPPTSLIFFSALAIFPKSITSLLFLASSLISLFITTFLLNKMFFTKTKRLAAFLICLILFIQYFPVKFTLTLGQINLIILLLITTAFYFFRKSIDIHAGVLLGIATLIKLFPGFLILFFVKQKKWKTVLSFCATVLIGLCITILYFKSDIYISYMHTVGKTLFLQGGEASYFDQSLNSFLLRLSVPSDFRLFLRLFATGTSVFFFLKTKNKALSYFGLLFSVLLFLPSFAWLHHYVILIPLFIVLWTKTNNREKLFLVFAYLLTSFHFRNPEPFARQNILLFSHPFIGAFLLWLLSIKKTLNN